MMHLVLLAATLLLAQAPAAPVTLPDTPAGRGLKEFVASFNAGGAERRTWVTSRTTMPAESAESILEQDAAILEQHGAFTVVRVATATDTVITAIMRHAKSGAHAHFMLEASAEAPFKVTNMQLRAATPDEIAGK